MMTSSDLHMQQKDWDLETGEDCSYCGVCDEAWPCTTERLRLLEERVANLRVYMTKVAERGHAFGEESSPAEAYRKIRMMVEYFLVHDRVDEKEY